MQLLSYINEPLRLWPFGGWRAWLPSTSSFSFAWPRKRESTSSAEPIRLPEGKVFNARTCSPQRAGLPPEESPPDSHRERPYQLSRGHGLYLYHTDFGNIAILICYDVEFPEVARVMAEAGAEILFVPSCTDGRRAFAGSAIAPGPAIENQVYVAMTGTVAISRWFLI